MKLEVSRHSISIIPENEIDEAYIEEVLGLTRGGDQCIAERINTLGLSSLAYVEVKCRDTKI